MIYKQYTFWLLVAGLVAYVVKYFAPDFPFSQDDIVAFFGFLLGLFGIALENKARRAGLM